MSKPIGDWQQVTNIERKQGSRGGSIWFLTLACDHHKSVRIPKFRAERMLTMRLPLAPSRVRCLLCAMIERSKAA